MAQLTTHSFEATTHSAISVVNAIPAGRGATIAVDIPCRVSVSWTRRKSGGSIVVISKEPDPHRLVKKSVGYAFRVLRYRIPRSQQLVIKIDSEIPTAVGLKSSSAVSVGVTKAIFGLFSKDSKSDVIIRSSCLASKDSGASLTGAYDDAAASLLGGVAFTDNLKFRLVKHTKLPKGMGSLVAILVPRKTKVLTSSLSRSSFAMYREESLKAFHHALAGDFAHAMLLNSIIQCAAQNYSMMPVSTALTQGASAAGITGKGPAVAAICANLKTLHRVKREWKKENKNCDVLLTRIIQPE
jgi:shikimate kinase